MKFCVSILFFLVCFSAAAQTGYEITYHVNFLSIIPGRLLSADPDERILVFNDSLSYFFSVNSADDRFRQKNYGHNLVDFSIYFRKNSDIIHTGYTKNSVRKNYMVVDSIKTKSWQFIQQTKTIEGISCYAALSVDNSNDSLLAWYTNELSLPFGPAIYNGLPGLILEIYDQKTDQHFLATKIRKQAVDISYPDDVTAITQQEFDAQRNVFYKWIRVTKHNKNRGL